MERIVELKLFPANVDVVCVWNSSRVAEGKIEIVIGLEFGLALILNFMVQYTIYMHKHTRRHTRAHTYTIHTDIWVHTILMFIVSH